MKIIKELSEVKLVILEMEVNLGNEKRKPWKKLPIKTQMFIH